MRRGLLICNPAAGRGDSAVTAGRLAERLSEAGFEIEAARTQHPGHAESLAREASAGGAEVVFSYGGDGTLRECAAGLLGSSAALGFLPGGTANVMTKVLRLPQNPLRAASLLGTATAIGLDIGLCNRRPMLMQASAGLDAEVLGRLDPSRKRLLGKSEVALSFLPSWWSFSYPTFEVAWGSNRRQVTFAAACNIPFYGGPWKIAPAARWDDGQFDLVLFRGKGRSAALGFGRDLLLGRHWRRRDVEIVRAESAEISPADGLSLQIDGDFFGDALPATVRFASERVNFLVPTRH